MFLQKIKNSIFKSPGGLLPLPSDKRDLGFWEIFGVEYKPKHTQKIIEPFSIKRQKWNTCSWNASVGAKEIDEKIPLSVRYTVIKGKQAGYIKGDGFSNLRYNQKILQKFGVCELKYLKEEADDWYEYSNTKYLNTKIESNAKIHRTKSYLRVRSINEIYKAIDNDRPVEIGVLWCSGFNMSGGFSYPYIIDKIKGYKIGGHALYLIGYIQNYRGVRVFVGVNSFGRLWGDEGKFYITPEFLKSQINIYGAFVNYDLDLDITKWLIQHRNKVVKGSRPDVYLIQDGKKRRFPDLATFYAYGYLDEEIIRVEDQILRVIPDGEPLQFWQGDRVKSIKAIIQQRNNLKPIFKKYFNELF